MSLLLWGDIHQCPGPVAENVKIQTKFVCACCELDVGGNSKSLSHDECDRWTHIRCCDFSAEQHEHVKASGADTPFNCPQLLSFRSERTDVAKLQDTDPPTEAVTLPGPAEMD